MVEYKTGYPEFMVTKLEMEDHVEDQTITKQFNSLSIAIVLSGQANIKMEGFESQTLLEKKCYYIMPGQQFEITKSKDDQSNFLVFFASCDI